MKIVTRFRSLTRFGTECLLLATLAPYLHGLWWAFELPAHFHPHIAVTAVVLILFTFLLRQRIVMVLAAVSLGNSVIAVYSVPTSSATPGTGMSILSQNVSYANESFEALLEIVEREKPDVVTLFEYTPEWEAAMDRLPDEYISRVTAPDTGAFGIAVFSTLPLLSYEIMYLGQSEVPAIAARFESAEFDGTVVALHLNPPIGSTWANDRNIQTEQLKEYLQQLEGPFVAIGDFNNTPWSPTFASFLAGTDWHTPTPTFAPTWPSALGLAGIPIDFAVAPAAVALGSKETVTLPGSDHLGIQINVGSESGSESPGSSAEIRSDL